MYDIYMYMYVFIYTNRGYVYELAINRKRYKVYKRDIIYRDIEIDKSSFLLIERKVYI